MGNHLVVIASYYMRMNEQICSKMFQKLKCKFKRKPISPNNLSTEALFTDFTTKDDLELIVIPNYKDRFCATFLRQANNTLRTYMTVYLACVLQFVRFISLYEIHHEISLCMYKTRCYCKFPQLI